MTNVSPSSQKVDDFLSKISQLSQERLRENQKTQRNLQSEIDALRSNQPKNNESLRVSSDFEVSQLTFNRSGRSQLIQKWAETPPTLPSRPKTYSETESGKNVEFSTSFGEKAANYDNFSGEKDAPPFPRRPQTQGTVKTPEKPQKPARLVKPRALENPEKPTVSEPQRNSINPSAPSKGGSDDSGAAVKLTERHNFGLIRPVASREPPIIHNRPINTSQISQLPEFVARRSGITTEKPEKMATFSDIENRIRARGSTAPESSKSSAAISGENIGTSRSAGTGQNWSQSLKPAKPLKPSKPTLRSFETKDAELLRDQISRLSPTKTQQDRKQSDAAPAKTEPKSELTSASGSRDLEPKSLRPMKPVKPKALAEPEAVLALGKLRKSQPKKPETAAVPEALQKFQSLKGSASMLGKPPVPRKISGKLSGSHPDEKVSEVKSAELSAKAKFPNARTDSGDDSSGSSKSGLSMVTPAKPDFHAHLASIIRSSTDPSSSPSQREPVKIQRASTVPETKSESQKLTHPNKARAKGPKRKLPKSGSNSAAASVKTASSNVEKHVNVENKERFTDIESPVDTAGTGSGERNAETSLIYSKPRKIPPPKAVKPNFELKPSRSYSGELFI